MTKWDDKVTLPKTEEEINKTNLLVLESNDLGQFEIAGLKDGKYTLVEIKAPEGYALPSNNTFDFNIQKMENNKKKKSTSELKTTEKVLIMQEKLSTRK